MSGGFLGFGAQGLALEVNPWQTKESLEAALLLRGAVVSGWANVESSLIELAIRASHHHQYRGHREAYPKKLKNRIEYLRQILDLPGPLHKYAGLGHAVLDRFKKTEYLRNMMAHARMSVLPDWGATFYFFQAKSGDEISYRTARLTERQLQSLAMRSVRFSRAVRMLIAKLDDQGLLPPLAAAE